MGKGAHFFLLDGRRRLCLAGWPISHRRTYLQVQNHRRQFQLPDLKWDGSDGLLAEGQGFSNPFLSVSPWWNPTAWEPPLYPLMIAGVFKLFGVYTHASAFVLLAVDSFFSALTCIPIFLIARRCFNERVAVWSACSILGGLASVIFWCTRWIWETSLAALLLAAIFLLALVMEDSRRREAPGSPLDCCGEFRRSSTHPCLHFCRPRDCGFGAGAQSWASGRAGASCWPRPSLSRALRPGSFAMTAASGNLSSSDRISARNFASATAQVQTACGWIIYIPQKIRRKSWNITGKSARSLTSRSESARHALVYIREDYGRFAWLSIKRFIYYWGGLPTSGNALAGALKNSLYLASSVLAIWGLGRRCVSTNRARGFSSGSCFVIRWFITLCSRIPGTGIRLNLSLAF